MDKHSGGISKGAEASPQPKQTNKRYDMWGSSMFCKAGELAIFGNTHHTHTQSDL
jgi:hypothetical protein